MVRNVAILQARMGSQRLPGKVLADLGGQPVMAHAIERARAIQGIDAVCVATSDHVSDDAVALTAEKSDAIVVRGSEKDVLSRYALAAKHTNADIIMRLTCDCPLIDPAVCTAVLLLQTHSDVAYASNVIRRQWPHGLDCEVFKREALDRAAMSADTAYDREHVTPFIRKNAHHTANLDGPGGAAAQERWVVDQPEDLNFLRALIAYLPSPLIRAGWREIFAVSQKHPEVAAINAHLRLGVTSVDPAKG